MTSVLVVECSDSGCDPISKCATVHTILPILLPDLLQRFLHDLKKKKKKDKCVMVEDISEPGGDLFNGAQYACLSTRSQLNLALVGFGFWGLDLNAQLITAMHCTAHICNRTEWLQDFIALTSFYKKKENAGLESRYSYIHCVTVNALMTENYMLWNYCSLSKAIVTRC